MKAIHVPALTGLRFVAAMMVLIGHGWSVVHFKADTITGRFLNPLPYGYDAVLRPQWFCDVGELC
jgi:peptidoglycan/LPS O-acetylase OafA/YrhL